MNPEQHDISKIDSIVVGELTSGSLHTLNNILQGIIGTAELLQSNPELTIDARMDSKAILDLAQDASFLVKKMKREGKAVVIEQVTDTRDVTHKAGKPPTNRSDIHILVSDDDPLVLKVVTGMLNALKYSTIATQDGKEALEVYRKNSEKISLVLADLAMPRMGGLQLAEQLLSDNPETIIVVMTGYLQEELGIKPDEFGLAAWIEKPITAAALEKIIKMLVGI